MLWDVTHFRLLSSTPVEAIAPPSRGTPNTGLDLPPHPIVSFIGTAKPHKAVVVEVLNKLKIRHMVMEMEVLAPR